MTSVERVSGYNIANRVATSVVSMAGRHLFTVLAGIVVARGLGPVQFGYFMFLLAGFAALHTLLDLSSSQAFFTLICKQSWPARLYKLYGGWIALQLALPLVVIWLLLPGTVVGEIWRGQSRTLVLMALVASFSQRVLWQAVTQVYESARLTNRVQLAAAGIMAAHLIVVVVLKYLGLLTIPILFMAITVEFAGTGIVMLFFVPRHETQGSSDASVRAVRDEFIAYVAPLIAPLLLGSVNSFAETWLLQIFGGATQQAFFNIAQQYANLGLVFGFPAVNVFWKEIAAAHARNDLEGMRRIYSSGTRVLFAATAFIAGFCMFWAGPIIQLLLGTAYAPAGPVFSVTLINSIFQCFGLIVSVAFLATGRTRAYSIFNIALIAISLAGSVLVLWVFRMGALGLAIKLAVLSVAFQLICDWYNCRQYSWKTDNVFRVLSLGGLLLLGGLSRLLVHWIMPNSLTLAQIAAAFAIYIVLIVPTVLYSIHIFGYDARMAELKRWIMARVWEASARDDGH